MASLNNQEIYVGDKVYDVTMGYGSVVSIYQGRIYVKFPDGIKTSYDEEGRYGGVRRLYWHNPVIIEPKKDPNAWHVLAECMTVLARYFN